MDVETARARLYAMQGTLMQVAERDSDVLVTGIGLSTLKALLSAVAEVVPDDPVLAAVSDFLTPDVVDAGHVRAVDALLVVGQVLEALPPRPPPTVARSGLRYR